MNLKPCNVKISTAKSGESIIATGIGDIRLNTWSEQGQPIGIVLSKATSLEKHGEIYWVFRAYQNKVSDSTAL